MQAGDSEDFKSLNASYSIWIYGFSFCRCLNTYSTGYLYEIPPTSADNLSWLPGRRYSNKAGSGCTSLGKYKIGSSYIGKWGYSYKLHGLDSSNNKALERTVVLHGHSCVPDKEVTEEICQSNGCPTVSPAFLQKLKALINTSKKPVLLWIYE